MDYLAIPKALICFQLMKLKSAFSKKLKLLSIFLLFIGHYWAMTLTSRMWRPMRWENIYNCISMIGPCLDHGSILSNEWDWNLDSNNKACFSHFMGIPYIFQKNSRNVCQCFRPIQGSKLGKNIYVHACTQAKNFGAQHVVELTMLKRQNHMVH